MSRIHARSRFSNLTLIHFPSSDLIGRVQVPVKQLMSKPGEMIRRTDNLVGFENATAMQGTLQ